MQKIFKPTCLVPGLWVFSCLAAISVTFLASCGGPVPQNSPPKLPKSFKPSPAGLSDRPYFGLTKQEAAALAAGEGRRWRIIREDGKSKPVTRDHRPDRLNFTVEQGLIVRVTKG